MPGEIEIARNEESCTNAVVCGCLYTDTTVTITGDYRTVVRTGECKSKP